MSNAMARESFARALLDPSLACPPAWRAWNGSDPARRLAVHRNTVVNSLVEALADTFPVVQALVGEEFFRPMAAAYVRHSPPESPLLAGYGRTFPAFIEAFAPARGLPYLADVARLEFARVQAFHARDAVPLAAAAARSALEAAGDPGRCRFELHPAVHTIASRFPVVSLWAAHQGHGDLSEVDLGCAEVALVLRPAFDVLVLHVPAGSDVLLQSLQRGDDLATAAAQAAAVPGFDPAASLAILFAHAAFVRITPEVAP